MKSVKKRIMAAVLGLCLLLTGMCITPVSQVRAASDDGWVGA